MAKVIDPVYVILIKATRKYFSMVLFITLDNVLTFQSLESNRNVWSYKWTVYCLFRSYVWVRGWLNFCYFQIWESFLSIE